MDNTCELGITGNLQAKIATIRLATPRMPNITFGSRKRVKMPTVALHLIYCKTNSMISFYHIEGRYLNQSRQEKKGETFQKPRLHNALCYRKHHCRLCHNQRSQPHVTNAGMDTQRTGCHQ